MNTLINQNNIFKTYFISTAHYHRISSGKIKRRLDHGSWFSETEVAKSTKAVYLDGTQSAFVLHLLA